MCGLFYFTFLYRYIQAEIIFINTIFIKTVVIKKHFFIFCLVASAFISCASRNSGNTDTKSEETHTEAASPSYDNTIAKGVVIDSVACRADKGQLYAVYLPSNYSSDKAFPCIFFFDSHARGAYPLARYKSLAEQYGFIFIGSDVSKNGLQQAASAAAVNAMINDAKQRFHMDVARMYTSGFSGGARVAVSVAVNNPDIAGVIGCSAGLPGRQSVDRAFPYSFTVGTRDFNFGEMQQLDAQLQQANFPHLLLTFDGIHSWPPLATYETALLWMQANAIEAHKQNGNDKLIAALQKDIDERIAQAKGQGNYMAQAQLMNGLSYAIGSLADVSVYQKQAADLQETDAYKEYITKQNELLQQEAVQQQDFASQFADKPLPWWRSRLAIMKKDVKQAPSQQISGSKGRVLAYMSMIGYMYTSQAIKAGDLQHAANYLAVFSEVDPSNPDTKYLAAVLNAKSGNDKAAIDNLQSAASLGYTNADELVNEPLFTHLQNDPGFIKAKDAIVKNMHVGK